MLKLEYLLEEAKSNGLPITKKRGILREYLQVMILNSIYKHESGKSMFFTGGTCLRFFYNMPRFSEDLDFDTPNLSYMDFKVLLDHVEKEIAKEGFSVKFSLEKRGNLYIAQLFFKDVMRLYEVTDTRGLDLMIKIEVYKPSWKIQSESDVLSLYGYNFSAVLLEKSCMASEKLYALFNRGRGRDIYDTLFMLKRKFGFDVSVLAANKLKGEPKKLILDHLASLPGKKLKLLADQVRPFLFKEDDTELILNALQYAGKFLSLY